MISKLARKFQQLASQQLEDETGRKLLLKSGSVITAEVYIGRGTGITGPVTLKGPAPISIGSFCAVGANVSIISGNHPVHRAALQYSLVRERGWNDGEQDGASPVTIGADCWIGDGAMILSGVSIGDGCVIAAGSVVTKSFGSYQIIGGVPAKAIKQRFGQATVELLCELKWWNWSDSKIDRNQEFFTSNLEALAPQEIEELVQT